jgi:hypothetical protein
MSETRLDIGKIRKVDLQGKTIEEWCKDKIEPLPEGLPYGMNYCSYLQSEYEEYNDYIFNISNNTVWEIIKEVSQPAYEDLEVFYQNSDGTISYTALYYDGGTCLEEIIGDFLTDSGL